MSDITLLKNKLLSVASSGIFANFKPEQIHQYYEEVDQFLLINSESINPIELFNLLEFQFYLALITSHDIKAKTILDKLVDQFDIEKSQRIKLLQSLYLESIGEKKEAMKLLSKDPNELNLSRRLTAFSRKPENNEEYINNLNYYLNLQPSDLVTWSELAHEYHKIGNYDKAIFCFKEILLQEPVAYPIFYKVGMNYYYIFLQEQENLKTEKKEKILEILEILINSRNNYLRSVEICDVYTKSWLGIYLITNLTFNEKLIKLNSLKEVSSYLQGNEKLSPLSKNKIKELENIKDDQEFESLLKDFEKN